VVPVRPPISELEVDHKTHVPEVGTGDPSDLQTLRICVIGRYLAFVLSETGPPMAGSAERGNDLQHSGRGVPKATVRPRCVNCGRCSAAHGPYRYAGWREGRRAVASGKQEAPHRRRNLHAFRRERLNMIPLAKAETCCSSSGTSTQP
jgi:hypothetical protein